MTSTEIISQLKTLGSDSIKKTLMKHGAREPFYGVKVEDLKKIMKKVKKDYKLSLELFDSGISDAMYLAGLIADENKMTKKDLQHWADKAYWYMITEYPVAWVTSESKFGQELALEWIESKKENVATAGWATLSALVAIKEDKDLDIPLFKKLIARVGKELQSAPNRVRYTMNGFLLSVGCYVPALTELCIETSKKIGKFEVDMGGTACKIPGVPEYIQKVKGRGNYGKKRGTARC